MSGEFSMKATVFILTFICMVSRHSCLEGWYIIKSSLTSNLGLSSTWLGGIDTMYLFCYSMGLYISGVLEDGYSMKIIISLGMILACFVYYVMIASSYLNFVSTWLFLFCWGLQGLLQSTVWPGTVSLIGNWFPKSSHGGWMGLWSCNSNIGNIVGAQVAILLLDHTGSWEIVMITVTTFMLISAIATLVFVQDYPSGASPTLRKGRINFLKACKLPGVIEYSCAYGCIKMLNYSMMMWLPYYLINWALATDSEKAILISLFDIAGIFSSVIAGAISDKIHSRGQVVITMLALTMPLLYLFRFGDKDSLWIYYVLVPLSGAFIVASSNLVTTCVATDLAHYTESHEHTHAMATVTGIIDGTGSLGAACGQIFIGWVQNYSWNYVFYFMTSVGAVSIAILIWPVIINRAKTRELEEKLIEN